MKLSSNSDLRCFSYGGDVAKLVNVAVWKFDVVLRRPETARVTCYVQHAKRGDAFKAFFAEYREAKIFGTGEPLTAKAAEEELGRPLTSGEVLIVFDQGEHGG